MSTRRSAAEPSTLTGTKSLIVLKARLHCTAHHSYANVGIAAQVLAFIERRPTWVPAAAFSVPKTAVSVLVAISVSIIAVSIPVAVPVPVIRPAIWLGGA